MVKVYGVNQILPMPLDTRETISMIKSMGMAIISGEVEVVTMETFITINVMVMERCFG